MKSAKKDIQKLKMIHFQNFSISAIDDYSDNSSSILYEYDTQYDVDLGIDTSNSTDEDGKQLF